MAIVVNKNQNAIFGKIDGEKFPNLPLDNEVYETLREIAKEANAKTNKKDFAKEVTKFKAALKAAVKEEPVTPITKTVEKTSAVEVVEKKPAVKGTTKVGNTNYQIKKQSDGQSYLFNGVKFSKFYIPKELLERIETAESKELDATPFYKFFIRALKGEKMTQDKLNRVCIYMGKPWVDTEEQQRLTEQGYSIEEAIRQASGRQVGITVEGLLSTYKASNLVRELASPIDDTVVTPEVAEVEDEKEDGTVKTFDDLLKEVKANSKLVDFVFVPVRNSKGHFLKRGGDEYIAEYNRQLDAYMAKNKIKGVVTTAINVESKGSWSTSVTENKTVKAVARTKSAEDFIYEPANQGQSGDAFYCGDKLGHDIQVGKVHYLLKWNQVNTDDHTTMVKGLHVGGMDYVKGYANSRNAVVHNIFVDPADIGACVAIETTDGAMRVRRYFVHSSLTDKPNRGMFNSSNYAAQLDAEWNAQFEAASQTVAEAEARIQKIREEAAAAQEVLDNSFN